MSKSKTGPVNVIVISKIRVSFCIGSFIFEFASIPTLMDLELLKTSPEYYGFRDKLLQTEIKNYVVQILSDCFRL